MALAVRAGVPRRPPRARGRGPAHRRSSSPGIPRAGDDNGRRCRPSTPTTGSRRSRRPTLVLHGAEDRLVAPANAEVLASRIPGAELRWLEGAGHLYHSEQADAADAAVLDFIARRHRERGSPGRSRARGAPGRRTVREGLRRRPTRCARRSPRPDGRSWTGPVDGAWSRPPRRTPPRPSDARHDVPSRAGRTRDRGRQRPLGRARDGRTTSREPSPRSVPTRGPARCSYVVADVTGGRPGRVRRTTSRSSPWSRAPAGPRLATPGCAGRPGASPWSRWTARSKPPATCSLPLEAALADPARRASPGRSASSRTTSGSSRRRRGRAVRRGRGLLHGDAPRAPDRGRACSTRSSAGTGRPTSSSRSA